MASDNMSVSEVRPEVTWNDLEIPGVSMSFLCSADFM